VHIPIFEPVDLFMSCGSKRYNNECPICTFEFVSDEKVVLVLLCGHRYHQECFDGSTQHSTKCVMRCEGASGVMDRVCLERFKPVSETISIRVIIAKGKEVPIFVKLTDPVTELHKTVRTLTGYPEESYWMKRAGYTTIIQDNADLVSFFGLEDGDGVNVTIRGFGGGKRGSASASGAASGTSFKKLRVNKQERLKELEEMAGVLLLRLQARHDVAPPVVRRMLPLCVQRCQELRAQVKPFDQMLTLLTKEQAETLATDLFSHNNVDDRFLQVTTTCFEDVFDEMKEVELQFVKTRELLNGLVSYALLKQYGDVNGMMSWTRLSVHLNKKVQNDVVREQVAAHAAAGVAHAVPADDAMGR
jgi:hypothetical protein